MSITRKNKSNSHTALLNEGNSAEWAWPRSNHWTKQAPRQFRESKKAASVDKIWSAWCGYLKQRKQPGKKLNKVSWTLLTLPSETCKQELKKFWQLLNKPNQAAGLAISNLVQQWQSAAKLGDGDSELLWAALAVAFAQHLPEMAQLIDIQQWWSLVNSLVQAAHDAVALNWQDQPCLPQLLAVELPLTLIVQLPEYQPIVELATQSLQSLTLSLNELLDGEGLVHAQHAVLYRGLLASWLRCGALIQSAPSLKLQPDLQEQYAYLVREWQRCQWQFSDAELNKQLTKLGQTLISDWEKTLRKISKQKSKTATTEQAESTAEKAETEKPHPLDWPSNYSEWAQIMHAAQSWKKRAARASVTFHQQSVNLQLLLNGQQWFGDNWEQQLTLNQLPLQPTGNWREVCHVSDVDIDYLEIELPLEQGFKIQRHIALPRQGTWCCLADAVLGSQRGELSYRWSLPFQSCISTQISDEHPEIYLKAANHAHLAVVPLDLNEWRTVNRHASLAIQDGRLILEQRVQGTGLFAPLWLHWDKQQPQPLTWRQLTVAEQRVNVPRDVAVGYRMQVANKQWLIYRTLTSKKNRTVLGANLVSEFLIARFKNGLAEPLIEVE